MENKTSTWFFGNRYTLIATVILVFALGLGIRFYDLDDLPLDFASTRQLFSALKARSMYYAMLPESANVPDWQRAMAVKQATVVIEPPIIETLTALTYRIFGEYLWIARIYSILFWVIAAVFLFLLARELASTEGAVIALLFYLFQPYGVIASRSFQPDPLMVAMIVVAAWGLYRWRSVGTWKWAITAGLLVGAAVFVKNVAVFPLGLAALAIVLERGLAPDRGWRASLKDRQTWVVAILSIMPTVIYTLLGIYTGFLAGQFAFRFFPELWTTGAFYLQWLGQIDGVAGLGAFCLAIAGLFVAGRRPMTFLAGLWLGYFVFGMTFAYHITTHDYYNLMLIPLVALSLAPVTDTFIQRAKSLQAGRVARAVLAALVLFIIAVQVWNVRVTLDRENWRHDAVFWAALGAKLGPDSGQVLTIAQDYGYRLAYWGWKDVDPWYTTGDLELRALDGRVIDTSQRFEDRVMGKKFLVITQIKNFDDQPAIKTYVNQHFRIYARGRAFIIYDLAHPKKTP
jgi:4-amino-4-deoxy-L-arabinose transferase-like glycosyltransferase